MVMMLDMIARTGRGCHGDDAGYDSAYWQGVVMVMMLDMIARTGRGLSW